jgi:hypothetical protein
MERFEIRTIKRAAATRISIPGDHTFRRGSSLLVVESVPDLSAVAAG